MGVTNFYAGSLKYGPSGKKRKTKSMSTSKPKTMKDYNWSTPVQNSSYVREQINYPSAPLLPPVKETDNSWKKEESKKFTVAPAYNKGAYQVIPRNDVEHIGK
jgi:hypothetical protein